VLPKRPYSYWEQPEIIDWEEEIRLEDDERCGPVLLVIATLGVAGSCRPRHSCRPRYSCWPRCYPDQCYP
jgi:predicted alpha/beta hydrolase family esterase